MVAYQSSLRVLAVFFCFAPGLWSMLRRKRQEKGSLVFPRHNGCKSLTYHGRLLSANVPNSPHEALRPRPGIAIHSGAINDFCKRFNIPNGLRQVCVWCVHGFSLSHYENDKAAVPNSGFFTTHCNKCHDEARGPLSIPQKPVNLLQHIFFPLFHNLSTTVHQFSPYYSSFFLSNMHRKI